MANNPLSMEALQEQVRQLNHRLEQAEDRAELQKARTEKAELQTRPTTLEELLELCHDISQSMSVEQNKSRSTQGSTTSPKGKCCPTKLTSWTDFPILQQTAFDKVYSILHPRDGDSPRLFDPKLSIETLRGKMKKRKIASENDLKQFQNMAVEDYVTAIISSLVDTQHHAQNPLFGQGVTFEIHSQTWRDTALRKAYRWSEDWEEILRSIPYQKKDLDPPPSAFKARKYPINTRSPYNLRKKAPRSYRSGCSSGVEHVNDGDDSDDSDDSDDDHADGSADRPESIETPSKKGSASKSKGGSRQQGMQGLSTSGNQNRQYCTQRCLLGLMRGSALDERCPNIQFHRRNKKGGKHLVSKRDFSSLVQKQLAADLDQNLKDLYLQGARGKLFQVTLASHGYTFAGKGTRDVFVKDLQHEGRMYDKLQSIQGKTIPVYLGNIDLERPWRDLGVRIIHMLLMSWKGEMVDEVEGARRKARDPTL
ncbi:MAG: hypothetical protein Q9164_006947 [Protoblastenia rupestris]